MAAAPGQAGRVAGLAGRIADLSGRVALVAGVCRPPGIGRATAIRLAQRGAAVVCADLAVGAGPAHTSGGTLAALEEVVEEVRAAGHGEAVALPLADPDEPRFAELAAAAAAHCGRIDICCNLLGATGPSAGDGPLAELSEESFRRCLELNLTGPFLLIQAVAREMIAGGRPGAIVLLSSYAAFARPPGNGALAAARSGVQALLAVLAEELAGHGIRCNAVAPLAVEPSERFPNPGLVRLAESEAGSLEAWIRSRVPLGRMQAADETAAVIAFLCSDEASFVSGLTIPVAGGARG